MSRYYLENVNQERLAKGIEALRSGEFAQTMGSLRVKDPDGNLSYCCLGVLTELALRDNCPGIRRHEHENHAAWYEVLVLSHDCHAGDCATCAEPSWKLGGNGVLAWPVTEYYGFTHDDPFLAWPVTEYYGFTHDDPFLHNPDGSLNVTTASTLNDTARLNFAAIADAFEKTYMTQEEQ